MAEINSYIHHAPGSFHFQIHSDLLKLVDGDLCAAALINILDFRINWKIGEQKKIPIEYPETWVQIDMQQLHLKWFGGAFCQRSIQNRLHWLCWLGIVKISEEHHAAVREYALDVPHLNTLLWTNERLPPYKDFIKHRPDLDDPESPCPGGTTGNITGTDAGSSGNITGTDTATTPPIKSVGNKELKKKLYTPPEGDEGPQAQLQKKKQNPATAASQEISSSMEAVTASEAAADSNETVTASGAEFDLFRAADDHHITLVHNPGRTWCSRQIRSP